MFKLTSAVMTASDLEKQVEEIKRNFDKPVQGAPGEDFGKRLKEAVRQRMNNRRGGFFASASPDDESFARKLSDATKRLAASRNSPRRARQQAERERSRYRRVTRRAPTKSG